MNSHHVVIAEDEQNTRHTLALILRKAGYTVTMVTAVLFILSLATPFSSTSSFFINTCAALSRPLFLFHLPTTPSLYNPTLNPERPIMLQMRLRQNNIGERDENSNSR